MPYGSLSYGLVVLVDLEMLGGALKSLGSFSADVWVWRRNAELGVRGLIGVEVRIIHFREPHEAHLLAWQRRVRQIVVLRGCDREVMLDLSFDEQFLIGATVDVDRSVSDVRPVKEDVMI